MCFPKGGDFVIGKHKKAITVLWAAICLGVVCTSPMRGQQSQGPVILETVLMRMDTQAGDFHSLSANVERTKVTVVVNDHSTETGSILVRGDKMVLDMKAPNPRTILRTGD